MIELLTSTLSAFIIIHKYSALVTELFGLNKLFSYHLITHLRAR